VTVFKNCSIVLPERVIPGYVVVEDGLIAEIGFGESPYDGVDFHGDYLVPGYIDVHVHGAVGHSFHVGDEVGSSKVAEYHFSHGTTTLLMGVEGALDELAKHLPYKGMPKNVVGIFMEGPFISPERPGAIDPNFIKPADPKGFEEFLTEFGEQIKYVAIAPEIPMAKELITTAKRFGIRVSAGHTMSTIEQLFESITWGVGSVCHTFNAMSPLHHREPGVVGGALLYDDLFTEIICDGIHIHPEVVKLLFKVKPHDKVVAITDSVALNGMPDGTYGRRMVRGKLITLTNGITIAGSSLTMDQAVKNMVSWGIELHKAIRSATANPAKLLGLTDRGVIAQGLRADLLRLDKNLDIKEIYVEGVNEVSHQ
jgi:N-acetylglucosamine-6-phosphate deacetylase